MYGCVSNKRGNSAFYSAKKMIKVTIDRVLLSMRYLTFDLFDLIMISKRWVIWLNNIKLYALRSKQHHKVFAFLTLTYEWRTTMYIFFIFQISYKHLLSKNNNRRMPSKVKEEKKYLQWINRQLCYKIQNRTRLFEM